MNDLVIYKPQMVIETYNGEQHFISSNNYPLLKKTVKFEKFIEINGELIATSNIRSIKKDYTGIYMNREEKIRLNERINRFKDNIGREPNIREIKNMALKILQNA